MEWKWHNFKKIKIQYNNITLIGIIMFHCISHIFCLGLYFTWTSYCSIRCSLCSIFYHESPDIPRYLKKKLWRDNLAGQWNTNKRKNSPELSLAISNQIVWSQNVLLVFLDENKKFLLSQIFPKRIAVCAVCKSEDREKSKEKVKWLGQHFINLLVTLFMQEIDWLLVFETHIV